MGASAPTDLDINPSLSKEEGTLQADKEEEVEEGPNNDRDLSNAKSFTLKDC